MNKNLNILFNNDVIEALEKQKPMKPVLEGDSLDQSKNVILDSYVCPRCLKRYEIDYDCYNYCPNCGQRIDRSDFDE